MNENLIVPVVALILVVVQFLFQVWDKKSNSEVIKVMTSASNVSVAAIRESGDRTLTAIKGISEVFSKYVEQDRRIFGIVKDLKSMHEVRDDDGRFMMYMPKEVIETQKKLTELTLAIVRTQENMMNLMERQERTMTDGHNRIQDLLVYGQEKDIRVHQEIKDAIRDRKS